MQAKGKLERQYMGCGYEPSAGVDPKRMTVWQPPRAGYHGPDLTTCAGYVANLPEVVEVAITRPHWKQGAAQHACEGQPTQDTLNALLILDSEYSALEGWMMKPSKDGGGGP